VGKEKPTSLSAVGVQIRRLFQRAFEAHPLWRRLLISAGHQQTRRIAQGCAAAARFGWAFAIMRTDDW
jgi:hypothetical protein